MFLEVCISIYKYYIFSNWFFPHVQYKYYTSAGFDLAKFSTLN